MVAWALVAVVPAIAQSPGPLESEVKATYLLNFGRFATWRPNAPASESFAICVIGRDPFGSTLDQTVAGETIDGRGVIARRIVNAADARSCRILFVSSSEEARLPTILPIAQNAGVLTVSDLARFSDRGGMIQFVPQDKRVRFQVNETAVEQAGLSLSSELLRVAAAVIRRVP
jgi:uncharacterized protein DUF4154